MNARNAAPSLTRQRSGQLLAHQRGHLGAKDFDGAPHFFMRQRRDAHLEGDARQPSESLVHVKYFFCHSLRVADQEGALWATRGVELRASRWRPAAFLPDLRERVRV